LGSGLGSSRILFAHEIPGWPQSFSRNPWMAPILPNPSSARVSIASYPRNVTYDPRCVLGCRIKLEVDPARSYGWQEGAATNQAAEEEYRVVRNGRVSARNSAPGVGTSPQDTKKARRNFLLRRALQCRGDWIRTSDLLNPIQEAIQRNCQPMQQIRQHHFQFAPAFAPAIRKSTFRPSPASSPPCPPRTAPGSPPC
jgi:hypothetical protein